MASVRAVAIKKQLAVERLKTSAQQLAEQRGIDIPPLQTTNRDPQLEQAQQLEWMADVLELIAAAPVASQGIQAPEKRRQPK